MCFSTHMFEHDERLLREALWLSHGCPSAFLYREAGEMLCLKCLIDFKRDDPQSIWNRLRGE